jgi:predicted RecA/RadA family phage recombinase
MKNFVQSGETITLITPSGGILSGAGLLVGSFFGIASYDAAVGEDVSVQVEGVFDMAKTAAQAFAQGATVYWDNTTKLATSTVGSNKVIGAALIAAAGSDATVRVRLNGVAV